MIQVKKSYFLTSAKTLSSCPPAEIAEVALLGRSNVGKSTFINLILDSAKLAKSSSTPGKTQLINFFKTCWRYKEQDFNFCFVDLPGFGYAKISKQIKQEWEKNLWFFLQNRSSIKLFIHLIDSRHQDLEIDKRVYEVLASHCRGDQRILKIYTKCDKITSNQRGALIQKNGVIISSNEAILKKHSLSKNTVREAILHQVFENDSL
ncbi:MULTISPECIES: ribosome biogenesis GTP-binding protein YihA/YsxC [unclassified Helicobacter]|uniref:ribosome biogenesis GTP-binding protein YihA/YsxC n=1 Tax=unclassified Helicobacter TaxID=2593540 RepID=UPI000CF07625|nr:MULTISPECIES: ribosome biogenesis GTP-binding protein YihA/YsxC [unclassified Helicobacter]